MEPATPNAAPAYRWLNSRVCAILLGVLVFAAYPDVLIGLRTFYFRDYGVFDYPIAQYQRDCFWRGELPLWNPLNYCGIPHLAQWNTSVLYPPSLFYLLLPLPWSLAFFALAHLVWAGLGMYLLACRWTNHRLVATAAGGAFAFNGLSLSLLVWPYNIAAYSWMPWVLWLTLSATQQGGRALAWASLAGACQMLAGSPETTLFTWVLVAALAAGDLVQNQATRWQAVRRLAGVVLLVAGLSAAQLLPFFEFLPYSQRSSHFTGAYCPMPLSGWANYLVPVFHCQPADQGVYFQYGQYWIPSYYVGIGTIALVLFALFRLRDWRVYVLGGLALVTLLLAMGDAGKVYPWFCKIVPGLHLMRYPMKFILLANFAIICLFALALRYLLELPTPGWPRERRTLAGIAGALLGLIALLTWTAHRFPKPMDDWTGTWQSGATRAALLLIILGTLLLVRRAATRRQAIVYGALLLMAFWFDILTHFPRQNPAVEPWVYQPGILDDARKFTLKPQAGANRALLRPLDQARLDYLVRDDPVRECLDNRLALYKSCNLIDSIPAVNGFYTVTLERTDRVLDLLAVPASREPTGLAAFLGIAFINQPGKFFTWETRTNSLPLVTAGQQPVLAGDAATLQAMSKPDFDAARVVYLPELAPHGNERIAKTEISHFQFGAQRLEFEVKAEASAWVVIAQSYYPAWRAKVNGRPVPLWQANYAFQALQVPAGSNHVVLQYRDSAYRIGLLVCAVALLAWMTLFLPWRRIIKPRWVRIF